jgi:preprotein translocase subunit YajC
MLSLLITPAYAQDAAGGLSQYLGSLSQFAPLVLIFGVFYFLLIRPQQQRQKQMKLALSAIKRGDRVVTAGGILATVQKAVDGSDEVTVEIAENVRVVVLRDTISSVIKPNAANDAKPVAKVAKT